MVVASHQIRITDNLDLLLEILPPEIRRLADQYLYDPVTVKVKTATLTADTVEQFKHLAAAEAGPLAGLETLPSLRTLRPALAAIADGNLPKCEVLGTARLAGIQAAKRCSELIPMCHPLPLTFVDVDCRIDESQGWIAILSTVRCEARTGAEMEALTAAAVAALTVVDMAKSSDPWMTVEDLALLEKSGGKSGSLRRPEPS